MVKYLERMVLLENSGEEKKEIDALEKKRDMMQNEPAKFREKQIADANERKEKAQKIKKNISNGSS